MFKTGDKVVRLQKDWNKGWMWVCDNHSIHYDTPLTIRGFRKQGTILYLDFLEFSYEENNGNWYASSFVLSSPQKWVLEDFL